MKNALRFGWTSKIASQYLYLWGQRGFVEPLGGHSDVHVNRLVAPRPDWEQALRRAGWPTQIPARPDIAVRSDQLVYKVPRFEIMLRPDDWLKAVGPGRLRGGSLPVLAPGWALADLVTSAGWGMFGLDPHDIDTESGSFEDDPGFRQAMVVLGAPGKDRVRQGSRAMKLEPSWCRVQ